MLKVRSVNLYGEGREGEDLPKFLFLDFLIFFFALPWQLWDMRGWWTPVQGQPSKCLWEGRGIIGQHASLGASHHDIA